MQPASIKIENNICFVSGDLHFANVMSVYENSLSIFQQLPELIIDFSRLTSSDSSGVAFIVELLNTAKKYRKQISLRAIPSYLLAIIKAARMEKLISH